ncbi:hypothetical protein [Prescottella equi]
MQIDAIEFVQAVRKRVANTPDKVYEIPAKSFDEDGEPIPGNECLYVERDQETGKLVGSCLLGCALVDIGVNPAMLDTSPQSILALNNNLGLGLPTDVLLWATEAQGSQDLKNPWDLSLRMADSRYPLPPQYGEPARD